MNIISDVGIGIFFMRPIAVVLTSAAIVAVAVPAVRALWAAARARRSASWA